MRFSRVGHKKQCAFNSLSLRDSSYDSATAFELTLAETEVNCIYQAQILGI